MAGDAADEAQEISSLSDILQNFVSLEVISADRLRDGTFLFYAVLLRTSSGEWISFVKQMNPVAVVRKAALFGVHSGSLRQIERPDLAISNSFDLVVTGDEIAILNRLAFDRLFNDMNVLASQVSDDIRALELALSGRLDISTAARETLNLACRARPTFARRLHRLHQSGVLERVDSVSLRSAIAQHGENEGDFVDADGRISISPARVGDLLDLLEGRWWTSDFGRERRRADAFRIRTV